MLKRIIGVLARLVAVAFMLIALSGINVTIRTWPNEAVMNIFITALMTCAGIALWYFGVVMFARARESSPPHDPPVGPSPDAGTTPVPAGALPPDSEVRPKWAHEGLQAQAPATSEPEPPVSASGMPAQPPAPLAAEATSTPLAPHEEPDAASAPGSPAASANPSPASRQTDIFDSLTPEDLIGNMVGPAGKPATGREVETDGVADFRLKDLPEIREAAAANRNLGVKLVRQANGFGKAPKLVVLLGWSPIAEIQPGEAGYQALIGHAGGDGSLAVADENGTLHGRLTMKA